MASVSDQRATCMPTRDEGIWKATFDAFASRCEVLFCCDSEKEAQHFADIAQTEALRIEKTFSRYRDDNLIHRINTAQGRPVEVDVEMAGLLDYASQCYQLSEGRFDITSGVLRRAWRFDGLPWSPDQAKIDRLLERVGWDKVEWTAPKLTLRPEMEIDLGGIGKEYAVDRVTQLVHAAGGRSLMVNFGGDIRALSTADKTRPWVIGIEDPSQNITAVGHIELHNGGVATSGDVHRFCLVDGVRYCHILNPRTGWPVKGAPRTVTVISEHCTDAGLLATLAMLHGPEAETFLTAQDVRFTCQR
jgi:thiamine biosynthesis lipoprotein